METLRVLYESLAVGIEVLLQKLWTRHLPCLELIGGSADGMVIIVTGPTSGIGKETAVELARRGAHVILACRSIARGEALKMEIEAQASTKGQAFPLLEVMQLDLASLESVRRFASAWMARNLPLDVLVCNAGLFAMGASRTETADGLEMHMATNHLGHFLLSLLLLPSMQAASKARGRPARVVSVSSRLHLMGRLHRSDPNMTLAGSYSSLAAYAQSKLAQVCFSSELTRRSAGSVRGIALHPGEVATEVVRTLPAPLQAAYRAIMGIILLTPAQGARSTVYCATSRELDDKAELRNATYYDSNCAPGACSLEAKSTESALWLWEWSAKTVGLKQQENLPAAPLA